MSIWLFLFFYMFSFLLVFSYSDWFIMWVGLEINMMSFISFMFFSKSKKEVEGLYKYFFVQGVGSCLVMFGMFSEEFMEIALGMKMGAGPFYFWFPEVVDKLHWWGGYLLMTFQKFLPLLLLSGMSGMMYLILGLISLLIGPLGSWGVSSVKKLLAFSSVFNLGWMMETMVLGSFLWMIYFFLYSFVMISVINFFLYGCIESISEIGVLGKGKVIMYVFVMGGIPPMAGFVMKWMVLVEMVSFSVFLSVIMLFSSLVLLFVYLRMVYGNIMGMKMEGLLSKGKEEGMVLVLVDFFMMVGMLSGFFFFDIF